MRNGLYEEERYGRKGKVRKKRKGKTERER